MEEEMDEINKFIESEKLDFGNVDVEFFSQFFILGNNPITNSETESSMESATAAAAITSATTNKYSVSIDNRTSHRSVIPLINIEDINDLANLRRHLKARKEPYLAISLENLNTHGVHSCSWHYNEQVKLPCLLRRFDDAKDDPYSHVCVCYYEIDSKETERCRKYPPRTKSLKNLSPNVVKFSVYNKDPVPTLKSTLTACENLCRCRLVNKTQDYLDPSQLNVDFEKINFLGHVPEFIVSTVTRPPTSSSLSASLKPSSVLTLHPKIGNAKVYQKVCKVIKEVCPDVKVDNTAAASLSDAYKDLVSCGWMNVYGMYNASSINNTARELMHNVVCLTTIEGHEHILIPEFMSFLLLNESRLMAVKDWEDRWISAKVMQTYRQQAFFPIIGWPHLKHLELRVRFTPDASINAYQFAFDGITDTFTTSSWEDMKKYLEKLDSGSTDSSSEKRMRLNTAVPLLHIPSKSFKFEFRINCLDDNRLAAFMIVELTTSNPGKREIIASPYQKFVSVIWDDGNESMEGHRLDVHLSDLEDSCKSAVESVVRDTTKTSLEKPGFKSLCESWKNEVWLRDNYSAFAFHVMMINQLLDGNEECEKLKEFLSYLGEDSNVVCDDNLEFRSAQLAFHTVACITRLLCYESKYKGLVHWEKKVSEMRKKAIEAARKKFRELKTQDEYLSKHNAFEVFKDTMSKGFENLTGISGWKFSLEIQDAMKIILGKDPDVGIQQEIADVTQTFKERRDEACKKAWALLRFFGNCDDDNTTLFVDSFEIGNICNNNS